MPISYRDCAETTRRLHRAVVGLERAAELLQVPALEGREWFELLRQKLLPQLLDDAFLVVAVVGGTNIGKSVIFNHIAGFKASATSPLASGTKHPVCLVPPGFADRHDLESIFQGFELREWESSDEALEESSEHQLFWRTSGEVPENLLLLDTPDIDSDAQVNWRRADHIRRSADVLIAVLTQQKYNDAAVKQFFRKAAAEDKAVIVVFNQCQLPEDEPYWPLWLDTFCRETGVRPEIVYIAPGDRRAAEANRLPFYERDWPRDDEWLGLSPRSPSPVRRAPGASKTPPQPPADGREARATAEPADGRSLSEDLSRLRFAEIKLRTLRGSLNHLLDPDEGVPAYLREVRARSARFHSAIDVLSADKLARLDDWPPVPNSLLVREIRTWWQSQREGWSAKVHGFYNAVGSGITWPFRKAREKMRGEQTPPIELYRKQERRAILETVEKAYERLTLLSDAGNRLLQDRLEELLGGTSRSELLARLEAEHAKIDLEAELERVVAGEMESFRRENPRLHKIFSRIDQTAAAFRPATSVVLFMTGFGPAGDAAAHLVADTAIQTVVHVAGDVTGGTVAAAVGDQAISGTAASGMGYIEAKLRKLHAVFIGRRVTWLLEMLREHLWGSLMDELAGGATLPQSDEYRSVEAALAELEGQMRSQPAQVTEMSRADG